MDAPVIVLESCGRTGVASTGKAGAQGIVQVCHHIPIEEINRSKLQDLTENNSKQVDNFTKYFISLDRCYDI